MNLIKLEGVCKRFGEKNLFNNLSMEIEQGEFVSIMGESGAGKTTLLNIIGMLEPPDRGNVTVCGQQSSSFSSRTATLLRRNHISYLMQNYGLIDTETVKYNLSISVHFKKLSKAKKKQLYSSALERVGLPGYEKRKIYTLSGGEQQRIALAKIMVKSPQLILADEPTGSLDARNRDIVLAMLRQLNEEGKTIVVVTHDPTVSACAKKTYKSWIAAIAAITACVLFAVNFRVTFVDGQSMEPTLKSHQLVLVKRTAASIQRDDIIVFRVDETVYIKRVVAVAGDTVQLKDSRVYINHVYLSPYTCDADIAAAYNLEADHYFVLGDNDGASIDSRDFGIISKEHIIGKVILF